MLVSVVITVKNEEEGISKLLECLLTQEPPYEIVVVDAESTDHTVEIVQGYADKHPEIRLQVHQGKRGEGRNQGVETARGEILAFIDGGCWPDGNWLTELKKKIEEGYDIVAGKTINVGRFAAIERVELIHQGYDVTFPACNLAYKKELFLKIGGFDSTFVTAEDVDLNFRAVEAGGALAYNEHAVVYRETSKTLFDFLEKAFWYGYGRKQLSLKHGELWGGYSPIRTLQSHFSSGGVIRLLFGFFGYLYCEIKYQK